MEAASYIVTCLEDAADMPLSYGDAVRHEPLPLRVCVVPLLALLALVVVVEALVHHVAALGAHLHAPGLVVRVHVDLRGHRR